METKHKLLIWQFSFVGLAILFGVLAYHVVRIKNTAEIEKKAKEELVQELSIKIRSLEKKNEMLMTAVLNMENKSMKTYPVSMQNMITAAKAGHMIDFNFYLRMMEEENKKKH